MKCPVCGKRFEVLWPNQWVYKRGNKYICSWGCIRRYDRKEANGMYTKTKKDGTPAKKPGPKKIVLHKGPGLIVTTAEGDAFPPPPQPDELTGKLVTVPYPEQQEKVNAEERLPIASVWSRALECGTFTKVQGIGMMLKDPECQILMSREKWEQLAAEIRVALGMLEV